MTDRWRSETANRLKRSRARAIGMPTSDIRICRWWRELAFLSPLGVCPLAVDMHQTAGDEILNLAASFASK